jgi:hypothetical protein
MMRLDAEKVWQFCCKGKCKMYPTAHGTPVVILCVEESRRPTATYMS